MAYVKLRLNLNQDRCFLRNPSELKACLEEQLSNGVDPQRSPLNDSTDPNNQPENKDANINPPTGQWYFISDNLVREVTESEVLEQQAYLLFYERIF